MPTALLTFLLNTGFALSLMILERAAPNYPYPRDWSWLFRALFLASIGVSITLVLGTVIEENLGFLKIHFDFLYRTNFLTVNLNNCEQGLIGYYFVTFFVYWWHRLRHYSNSYWRIFHQIHHSTYRLETLTAFYAHPTDFLANAFIVNLVAYVLLGYNLDAALWTSFWVGVFELWEHTNIKTPRWLGYLIVRPEMHRVHHERDRHTNNYGIPIWDILFGTYENSSRSVECGFDIQGERKLLTMLLFKRVE